MGDTVTIEYAQPVTILDHEAPPSIYDGYTLQINERAELFDIEFSPDSE